MTTNPISEMFEGENSSLRKAFEATQTNPLIEKVLQDIDPFIFEAADSLTDREGNIDDYETEGWSIGTKNLKSFLRIALEEAYNAGRNDKTGDERRRFYQMGRNEALRECVEVGDVIQKQCSEADGSIDGITATHHYQEALKKLLE